MRRRGMTRRKVSGRLFPQDSFKRGDRFLNRLPFLLPRVHERILVLVAFRREFMSLSFKLLAFLGKLLDLETVHQKSDLETVPAEHIHDAPDADAVAVFSFSHCRHVLLEYRIGWRYRMRALALQLLPRGNILRPYFPRRVQRTA